MFLSTNILCFCQFLLIMTVEYFNIQSNLFKPVWDQHTCLEQTSVRFIQVKLISETLDLYKFFFQGSVLDRFHSIARKTQALMIIFKCERLIQLLLQMVFIYIYTCMQLQELRQPMIFLFQNYRLSNQANFVLHLKISEQYVQKHYEFKMSNFI